MHSMKELDLKLIADLDTAQDYIKGMLWTIFFHRLFGTVVPHGNQNFLGVSYPTVDYSSLNHLINERVGALMDQIESQRLKAPISIRTYTGNESTETRDNNNSTKNTDNNVMDLNDSQLVFKCVLVLKFYQKYEASTVSTSNYVDMHSGGLSSRSNSRSGSSSVIVPRQNEMYQDCWEKWVLRITILNNENSKVLEAGDKSRFDFYKEDFEKNMFKLVEYFDKNKDHIPQIKTLEISPFPYKMFFALNTHDPSTLDTAFASVEKSLKSHMNDTDSSDYSAIQSDLDYFTTESGDVIVGAKMEKPARNSEQPNEQKVPEDDIIRNSYRYIRKFLE